MRIQLKTSLSRCLMLAAVMLLATGAVSALGIDGYVGLGEYAYFGELAPSDGSATSGQFWLTQDLVTFDVSIAVVLPRTYVDNSIGSNAIGWGEKGHTFDQLLKSDMAQFSFSMDGTTVLDFDMDYIHQVGNPYEGNDSGVELIGQRLFNEAAIHTGSASDILGAATSMEYNINDLGLAVDDTTSEARNQAVLDDGFETLIYNHGVPLPPGFLYESSIDGWVYDAIYEFQIDGDVFGNQSIIGFGEYLNGFSMTFEMLHASPQKVGEFTNIIPPPPLLPPPPPPPSDPPPIPEPATISLLTMGLCGLVLRKRV